MSLLYFKQRSVISHHLLVGSVHLALRSSVFELGICDHLPLLLFQALLNQMKTHCQILQLLLLKALNHLNRVLKLALLRIQVLSSFVDEFS